MRFNTNPMVSLSNAWAGASVRASKLMLESLKEVRALQLQTDVKAIEALEKAMNALDATDDPGVRGTLQATLAWEQYAQFMAYCNSLHALTRNSQMAFLNSWRDMFENWQASSAETRRNVPAALTGNASVDAWLKGMSDAAAYTLDAFTTATQQMGDVAQTYFSAARSPPMLAAPSAKKPKGNV